MIFSVFKILTACSERSRHDALLGSLLRLALHQLDRPQRLQGRVRRQILSHSLLLGSVAEGSVAVARHLHLIGIEGLNMANRNFYRINHVGAKRTIIGHEGKNIQGGDAPLEPPSLPKSCWQGGR